MNPGLRSGRALPLDEEVRDLRAGMDFREPRYRREVFLRFYEFHTRYRSHPGCVYYLLPWLAEHYGWDLERRLWFAFVNGNSQNPVTSLAVVREFPDLPSGPTSARFDAWVDRNYARLAFDTDRRYHRKMFKASVARYRELVGRGTQQEFFGRMLGGDEEAGFRNAWDVVSSHFLSFGRLSTFSYLEYLRISGLPLDCDRLFLDDLQGSKSHRNGLAKVLGRDDLDWHDSNPAFQGRYAPATLEWLEHEAAALRGEARVRQAGDPTVGYFTLESALCTYKSWHRPNRRYPNVYNDLLVDRLRRAERDWGPEAAEPFWRARKVTLPARLRLEDNPRDPGAVPEKQNWYLKHGQPVMLGYDYPELWSDFDSKVAGMTGPEWHARQRKDDAEALGRSRVSRQDVGQDQAPMAGSRVSRGSGGGL